MGITLKNVFKSSVHAKIIGFFHENPTSVDTPRGVAAWTGYSRNTTKKALEELAKISILNAHPVPSTTGYSYTHDKKIIKTVEKGLEKTKKQGGKK